MAFLAKETETCRAISSRLSRKNIKVALTDIRFQYNNTVGDPNNPTEEEIETIYQMFLPTDITITSNGEIVNNITPNDQPDKEDGKNIPKQERYDLINSQAQVFDLELRDEDLQEIDNQIETYGNYTQYLTQVIRCLKDWTLKEEAKAVDALNQEKQELALFLQARKQRMHEEAQDIISMTTQSMKNTGQYLRQFQTTLERKLNPTGTTDK